MLAFLGNVPFTIGHSFSGLDEAVPYDLMFEFERGWQPDSVTESTVFHCPLHFVESHLRYPNDRARKKPGAVPGSSLPNVGL